MRQTRKSTSQRGTGFMTLQHGHKGLMPLNKYRAGNTGERERERGRTRDGFEDTKHDRHEGGKRVRQRGVQEKTEES